VDDYPVATAPGSDPVIIPYRKPIQMSVFDLPSRISGEPVKIL
jgi:hypothetical protein